MIERKLIIKIFFVISKTQVEEQIQKAEQIIDTIEPYLKIRWEK